MITTILDTIIAAMLWGGADSVSTSTALPLPPPPPPPMQ
jgi:hypothetical protein